jgi:enoyl-CoA hydratase/carnithine racemase
MTEHIIVVDEESTRTITMRRPEKKNTLTQEMYLAMSDAIDTAQSDPAIRCLIVTGRSGVFTAGNDIADFLQAATAKYDVVRPRSALIFLQSLVNNRKPMALVTHPRVVDSTSGSNALTSFHRVTPFSAHQTKKSELNN